MLKDKQTIMLLEDKLEEYIYKQLVHCNKMLELSKNDKTIKSREYYEGSRAAIEGLRLWLDVMKAVDEVNYENQYCNYCDDNCERCRFSNYGKDLKWRSECPHLTAINKINKIGNR